MIIPFLIFAVLLVLVALAILLRPLLRRTPSSTAASRLALNKEVYRDQIAELERDRAAGTLSEEDFDQSHRELQRRLLTDASESDPAPALVAPTWRVALALALALPIAGAALYAWLGTPAALEPQAVGHQMTQAQIEQMVAALAARLKQHPDDVKGWIMLARSYKALHRFADAENAFEHIGPTLYSNPELLAEYADLLAVRANGNLDGKPMELVNKALKLDPNNTMALALAGTAAYGHKNYPEALTYWTKLEKLLPPNSEDAKSVAAAIAEIHKKTGAAPADSGKTVSGEVTVAPALASKLKPDDTVFIFAHAVGGPKMPLAVEKVRAADLPLKFRLDDALAINASLKLSQAKEVRIEARVSKSGDAMPRPGDLVGESAVVKPGAKGVRIVIDRVVR